MGGILLGIRDISRPFQLEEFWVLALAIVSKEGGRMMVGNIV